MYYGKGGQDYALALCRLRTFNRASVDQLQTIIDSGRHVHAVGIEF